VKELRQQFEAVITDGRMLRRGARVLVAVSGGVDSMVLLHLLQGCVAQRRWQLAVAHFNHQLRGRASDGDEQLVRATAQALGLHFIAGRADVKAAARRKGISLEMAARELRHAFLARAAKRLGCRTVALAQHADDQVELFFLRLLRGAGAEGLAGMKSRSASPADARIQLVRPLLGFGKVELESFANEHGIKFRRDASNASPDMLRNRVRLELLPRLRRRFQPALNRAVLRLMAIAGAESEIVAAAAQAWFRRAGRKRAWADWPVAFQRRWVQQQLQQQGLAPDFDLIEALRCDPGKPVSLGPRRRLTLDSRGRLQIGAPVALQFNRRRRRIAVSRAGAVSFDGLDLSWGFERGALPRQRQPGTERFDAGKIGSGIVLRHWQAGDRFQPIGMPTAVKLQDWFTNQKISAAQRRELVVATTVRGEIFWIEGLRIGERFKLTARTRRVLRWSWRR
jgi:tRNA(Ile)-lysidine synthase